MKLDVKDNNHAKMSHTQERFRDKTILNEEIKITFKEICELDDKIESDTGTLKVKIQRLAELYEEQYNLNGFPEQVHEICSELIRLFAREGKSNLKPYIVEVLDSKYKRVSSENSTSHLEREHSNLPEECSTVIEEYKEHADALLNPKTGYVDRNAARDIYDKTITAADKWKKICEDNNIALPTKSDHFDSGSEDKDEKVQKEKPVTDMTPEELCKLPYVVAIFTVANDFQKIGNNFTEYPIEPSDPLAQVITTSMNALHEVLEHYSNDKYRYDIIEWNDILYEAAEQGGTAAASHSGAMCAGLTDMKTGKPLFRNITKEQIDAIKLPLYNKMNRIVHGLPKLGEALAGISEHFKKYDKPWRQRRCALLSPKLQKKA